MTECIVAAEQLPATLLVWLAITTFIGWRMYRMGRFLERQKIEADVKRRQA